MVPSASAEPESVRVAASNDRAIRQLGDAVGDIAFTARSFRQHHSTHLRTNGDSDLVDHHTLGEGQRIYHRRTVVHHRRNVGDDERSGAVNQIFDRTIQRNRLAVLIRVVGEGINETVYRTRDRTSRNRELRSEQLSGSPHRAWLAKPDQRFDG